MGFTPRGSQLDYWVDRPDVEDGELRHDSLRDGALPAA